MATRFATFPPEVSRLREVRLAVKVLDPVTCERVSRGLDVQARGLRGKPIVNAGGMFVWTRERDRDPTHVEIRTGELPFAPVTVAVPALPVIAMQVVLSPTLAYPFSAGVSGVRGTLVERRLDDPPRPVAGAEVWLAWIDDATGVPLPVDAPVRTTTDRLGEFVTIVRVPVALDPYAGPAAPLRVRVSTSRDGGKRAPTEVIPTGRVTAMSTAYALDEFT